MPVHARLKSTIDAALQDASKETLDFMQELRKASAISTCFYFYLSTNLSTVPTLMCRFLEAGWVSLNLFVMQVVTIGIVGGSDLVKITEQIGSNCEYSKPQGRHATH